jgi:hypothetical protein
MIVKANCLKILRIKNFRSDKTLFGIALAQGYGKPGQRR